MSSNIYCDEKQLYEFLNAYLATSFKQFTITLEERMDVDINTILKESDDLEQFLKKLTDITMEAIKLDKISLKELIEEREIEKI